MVGIIGCDKIRRGHHAAAITPRLSIRRTFAKCDIEQAAKSPPAVTGGLVARGACLRVSTLGHDEAKSSSGAK